MDKKCIHNIEIINYLKDKNENLKTKINDLKENIKNLLN